MPRGAVVLLALTLVTASGTAAMSQSAIPPDFKVVATADLYTGVRYLKLAKTKAPVIAHVAYVAPGAPVDLRVVNANDKISTSTQELETTSSMCHRVRCVVGVNGDFHKLGTPAGAVIVDGRMLHSPDPHRPQLTVTADGRLVAGPLPWSASLSAHGAQIAVTAVNETPAAGGVAVYTPAYGPRTEPSNRTELVVRAAGTMGSLNQATDLELLSVRSGAGPIPADGAVLSGDGAAAQQLRDIWARRQNAAPAPFQLLVSSPVDAVVSLGAEPVVLRDGKRALPWRDPNLVHPRQPHTLVGWNKTGEVYLVAVDGRQAGSDGATMAEAADFLLALGATDAVNLDGGGGTTFVAGGSVWNRPSDNDPVRPAEYEERGGTNSLVVTSRPGAPLPAATPPVPKPLAPSPSDPAGTGGTGAELGPEAGTVNFFGGLGVDPFGPVSADGAPLAAGDLPLGPAAARVAAGSSAPGVPAADPSGAGPPGTSPPPDAKARPAGGGASAAKPAPIRAASTLTSQIVDVTAGNRSPWPLLGFIAGLALVAAGTTGRPRIGRRRAGSAA